MMIQVHAMIIVDFFLSFFLKISHKNNNFGKFCISLKVGCLASTGLPVHEMMMMTMMIIMMMTVQGEHVNMLLKLGLHQILN